MYFKQSTKRLKTAFIKRKKIHSGGFPERIHVAIHQACGPKPLAKKTGGELDNWLGEETDPSQPHQEKLAGASKPSLKWLASNEVHKCITYSQPTSPNDREMESLEEVIVKIRRLFLSKKLALYSKEEARTIRHAYNFYLIRGYHMDDASLNQLVSTLPSE